MEGRTVLLLVAAALARTVPVAGGSRSGVGVVGAQPHFRWLTRSECTTSVPYQLQIFGVENVCVDLTLGMCTQPEVPGRRCPLVHAVWCGVLTVCVTQRAAVRSCAWGCALTARSGPLR